MPAHEFGHIFGFRDFYFRGYNDLGADGYLVMEAIAEPNDIMGAPEYGPVLRRDFEKVIERSKGSRAFMQVSQPASGSLGFVSRHSSKNAAALSDRRCYLDFFLWAILRWSPSAPLTDFKRPVARLKKCLLLLFIFSTGRRADWPAAHPYDL